MANLNIGASLATVNTLAGLPVTSKTVYATLSAPSNLSLAEAMHQGQKLNLIVNPTANMILPMPTTTGWYTTFGDALALFANVRTSIEILCIGNGQYLVKSKPSSINTIDGHEYVDLGLPSGLLWATCNVGASQPNEYGKYFQWAATDGYYSGTTAASHSSWSTCPWGSGTPPMTRLDADDDAASVNMGGAWRMPDVNNTKELIDYTTSGWTSVSGVYGAKFTSKSNSNNSIFIPASGLYSQGTFYEAGSQGCVWSSILWTATGTDYAYYLVVSSGGSSAFNGHWRYNAIPVRGVIEP